MSTWGEEVGVATEHEWRQKGCSSKGHIYPTFSDLLFLYKVLNFHVVIVIDILFMVFFLLLLCLENSPILNFVKYLLHLIV